MRCIRLILAAILLIATPARAQPSDLVVDAKLRQIVVEETAAAYSSMYVFPDLGDQAARHIRSQMASGAYEAIADPRILAQRLTADLQNVAPDLHNVLRYDPRVPASAPASLIVRPARAEAGVVRADRLIGNVGYIEIEGFTDFALAKPSLDRAIWSVRDTRALIIDLRRNGGGDEDNAYYLLSHFLEPGKRARIAEWRYRLPNSRDETSEEHWSVATPVSFYRKPLYLLIGPGTFSGGEILPYEAQAMKVGVVVGQRSRGGAHSALLLPIASHFTLRLSGKRAVSATTGGNWEGRGVTPDIVAPVDDALKTALEALGERPSGTQIADVSDAGLFAPRATSKADSEPLLRAMIEAERRGAPIYARLTPEEAEAIRKNLPERQSMLERLGSLRGARFMAVGPLGADIYSLEFEHGWLDYRLDLTEDGRARAVIMTPVSGPLQLPASVTR